METTKQKATWTDIVKDWTETIEDLARGIKEFDCDPREEIEEFKELLDQQIWETIDGCEDVIYTYQAKEISKIIGKYDAFDEWLLTGERFDNWSQVAFANIYDLISEEIDIDRIIRTIENE